MATKSSSKWLLLAISALMALQVSCGGVIGSGSTNPKEPEGGYNLFLQALQNKDTGAIWENIDASSKILFRDALAALLRMDRIIEIYFDPVEHKHMRARTGTYLLKEENIETPADLFSYIIHLEDLDIRKDEEVGAMVTAQVIDKANNNYVTFVTKADGQQFLMIRESDGNWRTAGLRNVIIEALNPIFLSEDAMRKFAKDNFEAEIKRRREVISYFTVQEEVFKQRLKQ